MQTEDCVTGMQHLGIPVKNMTDTLQFYQRLGFHQVFTTINDGSKVVFVQRNNLVLELYEDAHAVGKAGAIDHVALDVTDIENAFAQAKEQGQNLLDEEIQFLPFWANGVRFFTIQGPNAEKVEFSQIL